jgi:hypothetical protein
MGGADLELDMPLDRLMALVIVGLVGVMALFGLLALIRLWGLRMQKGGGPSRGLDMERLRRQRDAGEIAQDEYDAIYASLAGGAAKRPAKPRAADEETRPAQDARGGGAAGSSEEDQPPRGTIDYGENPGESPERSDSDGQG